MQRPLRLASRRPAVLDFASQRDNTSDSNGTAQSKSIRVKSGDRLFHKAKQRSQLASLTMKLLFPLLLLSAATNIHGFQVQPPLRTAAVTLSNPRFGFTQKSSRVASPRRSVANESIEHHDGSSNISSWNRLVSSLPRLSPTGKLDKLDKKILSTCIPTMLNLMVVPIVNAVDTFYVGRLRDPLALAAQSAANQCFFTVYFLAAFLPTITAPVVARAIGEKKWDEARDRVCEVRIHEEECGTMNCILYFYLQCMYL